MGVEFDDSTGISYEQYPKDPKAREQIAIVNNKVDELKEKVVSKQEIINLEQKVRQSGYDNENKIAKRAGNLAKRGWEKEYDFIEVDLALLERLAQYARLLAM